VNLILDTHSFIWFVEDNPSLSFHARTLIEEPTNDVFLSIASVWEMAIKVSLGKLDLSQPFDSVHPQSTAAELHHPARHHYRPYVACCDAAISSS